ncbi:glycosyl hydrolase family 61-domain-containing protein [Chytridium lagenaria]|nr:glycosyl hydrolase family 61-domain-containing protein [Chytridium lagenaria]
MLLTNPSSTVLILASMAFQAYGHTILFSANTAAGNVQCIRQTNRPSNLRNAPIKDISSQDMICGGAPTRAAPAVCEVAAGQSLELIWGHENPGDSIIDARIGPCNMYMSRSAGAGAAPTNNGWFKIFEGTWDPVNLQRVQIPANLAPGNYFLRAELNTLHEANVLTTENPAQIRVTGNGNLQPRTTVSIPGHINNQTPGLRFNPFAFNTDFRQSGRFYPNPFGPAVAQLVSPATNAPTAPPAPIVAPPVRPPSAPPAVPPARPPPAPPAAPVRPPPAAPPARPPSPPPAAPPARPAPAPPAAPVPPPATGSTLSTTFQSAYCSGDRLVLSTVMTISPTPSASNLKTHTGRVTRNGTPINVRQLVNPFNLNSPQISGNTFTFREVSFNPSAGFQMIVDVPCSYSGRNPPSASGFTISYN